MLRGAGITKAGNAVAFGAAAASAAMKSCCNTHFFPPKKRSNLFRQHSQHDTDTLQLPYYCHALSVEWLSLAA